MNTIMTPTGDALTVAITAKAGGIERLLTHEPVCRTDLLAGRDYTWWQGVTKGLLPPDLDALTMRVLPGENIGGDWLAGFSIEMHDGRRSFRHRFSVAAVAQTAQRAEQRLLDQKVLKPNDEYNIHLTLLPADSPTSNGDSSPDIGICARKRSVPLRFEKESLAKYLAASEPMPGVIPEHAPEANGKGRPMHVFFTDELWNEGRVIARRGGEDESAGMWTGRLIQDTDSPQVFTRVDACVEAEGAKEEKAAVTFTGETWNRVNRVLEMRRRKLKRPNEIYVGSVHGHNFMPQADAAGNRQCEHCHVLEVCSRTTAVASLDDTNWHLTHFARQPWATLLIWGWNAREQEEWRMYGLSETTLAPRSVRRMK
ncbi:MAG: hypothetical protein ACC628_10820 [Pirellulaceae bacterium]